ncbi:hypothetical protein [Actinomadura oligospora]|uniref:hypothetical protein n=1 Tax=Actinomadura oligospora TaxID=111804 RepID=UPI00047DD602|nr:hypothetical protein [Actinomadura oligospora]
MNGILLTGNLAVGAALLASRRTGGGRRKIWVIVGLVAFGTWILLAGHSSESMLVALMFHATAAMLLVEMTALRRLVVDLGWMAGGVLLLLLNLPSWHAGDRIAAHRSWVTVSALAVVAALTAAAVRTNRLARDPDIGPGGT